MSATDATGTFGTRLSGLGVIGTFDVTSGGSVSFGDVTVGTSSTRDVPSLS